MSGILDKLDFNQRIKMCFWGSDRRYKYFDYLADGMHQRAAYKSAKSWKKKKK